MENTSTMEPYTDSPTDPRITTSPASCGSSATIKPLPLLPTYVEEDQEHYHDDPPTPPPQETYPTRNQNHIASLSSRNPPRYHAHAQNLSYAPYTDEPLPDAPPPSPPPRPSSTDNDDVPLAQLLLQPQLQLHNLHHHHHQTYQQQSYPPTSSPTPPPLYPLEAPPSYSAAVRQSRSYHSTLIQYIPSTSSQRYDVRDPLLVEIDEESGAEMVVRADDVRHSVENVVAMFVVASLLLVVAAVLGWLALGSGIFG